MFCATLRISLSEGASLELYGTNNAIKVLWMHSEDIGACFNAAWNLLVFLLVHVREFLDTYSPYNADPP